LHEKKFQEAYDAACKSIELLPDNSAGFCNKGEAELKLGRTEEALTDLTKAATSEDQACAGEAHYFRSVLYDKLGKSDLAKQDREISKQLGLSKLCVLSRARDWFKSHTLAALSD